MKNLFFTFLIIIPFLANTQTFWNVVEDDNLQTLSKVTDKGLFQDSIILVSGFVSEVSCHYHKLFAYDLTGEKLWETRGYHDLIYAGSNYIYTAGFTPIDDYFGYEQIVISKYDANGDEVFSIGYPEVPHHLYFEFSPQNIEVVSDGTILVSSPTSIVKSNVSGAMIMEYELDLESEIKGIHAISPIDYLIFTQNKIYKSNSSLIIVDSVEFSNSINQLLVKNDAVFTLLDSHLIRMDKSLNIIDTVFTDPTGIKRMELYGNDLYLQLNKPGSVKLINLREFDNPDTLTFPILVNNLKFIVTEGSYTFIGNSFSQQIGLYNFQSNHSAIEPVSLPDIELVDFDINNIQIEYTQIPGDTFASGFYFHPELTIKNNGKETITSFAVYSQLDGGMNCAQNIFYRKYTDFDILPDQTLTVQLNGIYQHGVNNTQFCFRCLAPNSSLETVVDNNFLCKTFSITGVEDDAPSNLKVYPNPVTDYVTIENPDLRFTKLELIDINGRILMGKDIVNPTVKINFIGMEAGAYILRMSSENDINTQVIIKK